MIKVKSNLNNIFDPYDQSENRITNALLQTMAKDVDFLKKFLRYNLSLSLNRNSSVVISSQKEPLGLGDSDQDREEIEGIPDGWIIIDENDAVLIESKIVRNAIRKDQLLAHKKRIRGYSKKYLCVITPDDESPIQDMQIEGINISWISWSKIYEMLQNNQRNDLPGYFKAQLKEYLAMSEDLVGFQGIYFPSDTFNRREAKIIIKNLIKTIKPEIIKILPKLTYEKKTYSQDSHPYAVYHGSVWSSLGAVENFTKDMHLTFWIAETHFGMGITVPNDAGKRWRRLKSVFKIDESYQVLLKMLFDLRKNLPNLYLEFVHRHYRQRRDAIIDGIIEVNFDTLKGNKSIKPNPLWLSVLRELISHKSGYNRQLMLRTRFFYNDHADIRKAIFKDNIIETARNFKEVYEYFSV